MSAENELNKATKKSEGIVKVFFKKETNKFQAILKEIKYECKTFKNKKISFKCNEQIYFYKILSYKNCG